MSETFSEDSIFNSEEEEDDPIAVFTVFSNLKKMSRVEMFFPLIPGDWVRLAHLLSTSKFNREF